MIVNRVHRGGTVLLAVLVVVVLLSLAAYQYSELMTAEYRAADSAVRSAQARTFAVSGVHYMAAALADANTLSGALNNNWYDNIDAFKGKEVQAGANERLIGRFSLVAPPAIDDAINGSTTSRFGVTDESGKININALVALDSTGKIAHDVLILLPNMTEEIADAIIDWIDADDESRANGAENDYYGGSGYRCKNGPLDTLEELLLVRGVTPLLLFGSDTNRNGKLDDTEDGNNGFDPGWASYLTVYSRELNRGSDNQPRIYLNDSDVNALYDKLNTAVGEELATWIVAYRLYGGSTSSGSGGGSSTSSGTLTKDMLDFSKRPSSISSIASLIDGTVSIPQAGGTTTSIATINIVGGTGGTATTTITSTTTVTATPTTGSGGGGTGGGGRGGTGGGGSSGAGGGGTSSRTYQSPLRDAAKQKELLPLLYDKVSTRNDAEIPARININTASKAVLTTLPGLDENDVQTILDTRPIPGQEGTDTTFQSPSWLVTDANLTTTKLRTLERYITAKTQTFRVQSLGYFDKGGPVARIEAVIDTNGGAPRILLFRDLTELGRGFEVPR